MAEIIVKYGCDRCGKYFDDRDDLNVVRVKFLRKGGADRSSVTFDTRDELVCDKCYVKLIKNP